MSNWGGPQLSGSDRRTAPDGRGPPCFRAGVTLRDGYAVSGGLLQSEGWWTLAPNGCQKVMNRSQTVDYTTGYLYAEASNGGKPVVDGDQNLCVQSKAFTIRRHQNCEGRKFRTVQSRQVAINLNKNHTTNITGPSKPGTVKYD